MVRKKAKQKNESLNEPAGSADSSQSQDKNIAGAPQNEMDKVQEFRKVRRHLQLTLLLAIAGVVASSQSYKFVFPHPLGQSLAVTQGVIVRSAIVRNRRMQFPQSVTSRAQLTYQYTVDGRTYENTDGGLDSTDDKLAGDNVNRHPQGSAVDVLYAVSDPRTSYLRDAESKPPALQVGLFVAGVLALVVALFLLLKMNAALRRAKRNR
jgi:hypothetical protein